MFAQQIQQEVERDLSARSGTERTEIARRVVTQLETAQLARDRIAAEHVARVLANDALQAVRLALMEGVKRSRFLPKDVARRIAHDIAGIAAPFLRVTDVFSEPELAEIALTIEQEARVGLASRDEVPAVLADTLVDIGPTSAVKTLAENQGAELTAGCLAQVLNTYSADKSLMETLALRGDLPTGVVGQLLSRISERAQEKLARTYRMVDFTSPVAVEARTLALARMIATVPAEQAPRIAANLRQNRELTPELILRVAEKRVIHFVIAALSLLATVPRSEVAEAITHRNDYDLKSICERANVGAHYTDKLIAELRTHDPDVSAA
ncbi:hypothetical protein CKO28_04830 [Rhodovibrio sodomensis]|uniref:DUF2336 domain-containing protein n=1 Tax=Rhodovibrio sodomensis TaxID=1088 RepID=A0ABS1DCP0_9PROT|nr:DUF2336 domain-containing protein [Rhodovibrio sodomensis]MBK1667353.1 hypothetical protein [Rhodovibrio sodomensis]